MTTSCKGRSMQTNKTLFPEGAGRLWLVLALSFLSYGAMAANTWYVAKDDPNASDANVGSEAAPFRTIQAALDNPNCVAGDTILVKPGFYDEGGWVDDNGYTNRVSITRNGLVIKSTDGAAATHIVGAKDPSGTRGIGPAAIRCIRSGASDVIVEGFTLRDGATFVVENSMLGDGGGLLAGSLTTYLVDCVVTNCVGVRGGGMRNGTAVRCVFMENYATVKGAAGRDSRFFNCLIVRNESQQGGAMATNSKIVNCTLGDFHEGIGFSESSRLDNTIVSLVYSVGVNGSQNAVADMPSSGPGHSLYNSVVPYDHTVGGSAYFTTFTNGFVTTEHLFLAPLFGDYRLLPGTVATTAGDAAQLAIYNIDERIDRWRDLNGVPIPQSGPIAAGCYQTIAPAPAAGAMALGMNIEVGGRKVCSPNCYAYPEIYPTQWWIKAVPPEGTHFLRFTQTASDGFSAAWAPITMDERLLILPPPVVTTTLTTSLSYTQGVRYVDPEVGDDEANDGLTAATPFKTLQRATDTVTNQATVIYCAAGDYHEGGALGGGVTNRVCHTHSYAIRFVGAGADRTFIRGAKDTTSDDRSDDGRGPAAIRCVYATSSCMFQGFTFVDGHSSWDGSTGDGLYAQGGAILNNNGSGLTYLHVTDCVITNCSATRGGAAYKALITRSRVTDCYSTVCGLRSCRLYACLLDNNPASTANSKYGILGPDAPTWFCTVVGRSHDEYVLDASDSITNTILVSTRNIGQTGPKAAGSYVWDIPSYTTNPGAPKLDPQFADAVNGDYAIMASSPAAGGGVLTDKDYQYWTPGYDGYPVSFVGRKPTAGAFQCLRPAYTATASAYGAFVGKDGGVTNAVAAGGSVTLTYTNGTRRCLGLRVNGELQEGVLSWTYTAPADASVSAPVCKVSAEDFSPDWYVDATNGSDANDGFTPATAKKTLAEAMTNTCLLAGDVVLALPGVYDEGTQPLSFACMGGTRTIESRVEVPANVTLVSVEGPERTIIKGSPATSDADEYGLGPGAVRCAALKGGARLEGFTLTGGRTDKTNLDQDDYIGSAVMCGKFAWTTYVVDCIISNNVTVRRTVAFGKCVNCRFFDNKVTANSVLRDGYLYNCVIDHNRGSFTAYDMRGIYNCTFGLDNKDMNGSSTTVIGGDGTGRPVCNTLCLGGTITSSWILNNCALVSGNSMPQESNRTNCLVMAQADYYDLDADLRPASRTSPLVDAGSNAWVTAECEVADILGGQRIYNGNVDIGAYEFDWRSRYAQILGSNRLEVTNASPEVVEVESAVRIPAGASLGLTWGGPEARTAYRFTADLSGGGDLTLEANGGVAACVSGVNEFRSDLPVNTLGFLCAGAGYADISTFKRRTFGATLSFR